MAVKTLDVPDNLVESVVTGRCVLFAGAGVSLGTVETEAGLVNQRLPTWGELLNELVNRQLKSRQLLSSEAKRLKQAVKDKDYLLVSEAVRGRFGASEYDASLDEIFRNPTLKPTKRHEIIRSIPFSAIVTTNYDKLLETAYAQAGHIPPTYAFDNASDIIAALSHNRFFILKAHGDIDRKDTVILSENDYRNVLYRQPGYRAALNTIFISKTVLFVGTSLADTDVKLVLESVSETFSGKGPTHYALVARQKEWDTEVQHWRRFFGIQLLQYTPSPGHPEVDEFLISLKKKVDERRASK